MKLTTQEIQAAFKIVDQVDTQPGLASSQFVRLEARKAVLHLSLTGLCIGQATCPILEPGTDWTWYLDRRVLQAFLSAAKSKTVAVEVQKDRILWKSGRQRITATAMAPVAGYSVWDGTKGSKLPLTPELSKELALHAQYAPTTATTDHLSAVCLCAGYGILASDSFVVAAGLNKAHVANFRLPSLLAGKLTTDGTVLADKTGAGIRYPQGYLYQPMADNCITGYPLKKITQVVAANAAVKPLLKVEAKVLLEALEQLKSYIFGTATDVHMGCSPSKVTGQAALVLDVIQGQAQTSMVAEYTGDFKLSWEISKLLPWVTYIAGVDPKRIIICGQQNGCTVFSSRGKPHFLLIVAEKG